MAKALLRRPRCSAELGDQLCGRAIGEAALTGGGSGAPSGPTSHVADAEEGSLKLVAAVLLGAVLAATVLLVSSARPDVAAAQADSCPNAAIRDEQSSTRLPDCRAYEVVSQLPTGGVLVDPAVPTVAEDGNRVMFGSNIPLPGSELPPLFGPNVRRGYISERGESGWQVHETGLPGGNSQDHGAPADASRPIAETPPGGFSNLDFDFDPDDQNGTLDVYQRQPDGELTWISRDPRIAPGTPQTATGAARLAADPAIFTMSADGRTVVFASGRQLTDDDTTAGNAFRLYKWDHGELSFIGKRPDGSVPDDGSRLGKSANIALARVEPGAVSRDGARVVYYAKRDDAANSTDTSTLYVQTDGQPTVEAVKETGVDPLPSPHPLDVTFRGASADASRVFFTSNSRLTPDSGASNGTTSANSHADLYFYDLGADEVRDLTPRLDGGTDPSIDPAVEDRARVLGTAAVSDDGRRVYFVSRGALDAEPSPLGEPPAPDAPNLYLAELGAGIDDPVEVRFIATLAADDTEVWDTFNLNKSAYASPDGSVLGFASTKDLTGQPTNGTLQLFVYDAEAQSLACASCPADGSAPTGDVGAGLVSSGSTFQYRSGVMRWVSSGGEVFFNTPTPLVAADRNLVDDVYEYDHGALYLISAGTGPRPSILSGASTDGTTVFFNTTDALATQDDEPGIPKIYAARVGGGFPAPSTPAPPCSGEGCRSQPRPPLVSDPPASSTYHGPGGRGVDHQGKSCNKLKRKAERTKKQARKAKKRAEHLKRRARKLERRANRARGGKAKRLDHRADKKQRKARRQSKRARKKQKHAKREKNQARKCKRGAK